MLSAAVSPPERLDSRDESCCKEGPGASGVWGTGGHVSCCKEGPGASGVRFSFVGMCARVNVRIPGR